MASKHVLISGYFGFGNAGDEAILRAMVTSFRQCMPDIRITVLSANPKAVESRLPVTSIRRNDILGTLRAYLDCDLFISGGGGLLQDTTGVRTIQYYLGMVQIARMFRKPVMFFAQGIGPIRTQQGRDLVRKVANHVQLITVRDDPSRDLLKDIGVNVPPLYVTADPVLVHEPAPPPRVDELLAREGVAPDGLKVGVSVRPWHEPPTPLEAIGAALRRLAEARGCQIVVFPFQHNEDMAPVEKLAGLVGPAARVVRGQYDTPELQGLIGRMDLAVAMRLHCDIFAATMHVPMLGLSYDPKVRQFLELVGAPSMELADITEDGLFDTMSRMLDERDQHRARLKERMPPLRERALETTRHVCRLLYPQRAESACCAENPDSAPMSGVSAT